MGGVDVISVNALVWSWVLLVGVGDVQTFGYVRWTRRQDEKIGEGDKAEQAMDVDVEVTKYPKRFLDRLQWIGILISSIRLNNWTIGQSSHDRHQPPIPAYRTRMPFIKQTLISFVRGYILLDLSRAYIEHDAYFINPSLPIISPLPIKALSNIPFLPRLFRSIIIGTQAWAAISQMQYLPCIIPVTLNAAGYLPDDWSPHTWAPLFGSPSAILSYGIRGFWGQYWHQAMRVTTSTPGHWFADTLRFGPESAWRYAVVVSIAFGLSGWVHMGLVPPEPLYATAGVGWLRLKTAGFFWLQPVGILLEVVAGTVLARLSSEEHWRSEAGLRWRTIANAVFFTLWSVVCLPLLGELGRQIGYWRVWPVPISIWKGLMGEGWLSWSST